jgi:hypothetical protein
MNLNKLERVIRRKLENEPSDRRLRQWRVTSAKQLGFTSMAELFAVAKLAGAWTQDEKEGDLCLPKEDTGYIQRIVVVYPRRERGSMYNINPIRLYNLLDKGENYHEHRERNKRSPRWGLLTS